MTEQEMTGKLEIRYVALSSAELWEDNPKLHDLGGLAESFKMHGFRDAPIFDGTLKRIVAGNGRITALRWMQRQGQEPPRGIIVEPKTGEWFVPIQFGVDSPTPEGAKAFAIDHNNITLMGGNFTVFDMAKMWDESYQRIVVELAEANTQFASMSGDDIEALLAGGIENEEMSEDDDTSESGKTSWQTFKIEVQNESAFREVVEAIREVIQNNPEWGATIRE